MIYFAHRMHEQELKTFMDAVDEEVIAGPLRADGQWASALREAEIIVCQGSEISEDLIDHCVNARWYHFVPRVSTRFLFNSLNSAGSSCRTHAESHQVDC